MLRRDVLGLAGWTLGSFAISAAGTRARIGMRARIIDMRLAQVKVVRELGIIDKTCGGGNCPLGSDGQTGGATLV
jgi:hypothetical protein